MLHLLHVPARPMREILIKPIDLQKAVVLTESHLWAYVKAAAETKQMAAQISVRPSSEELAALRWQKAHEEESLTLYLRTRESLIRMLIAVQQPADASTSALATRISNVH